MQCKPEARDDSLRRAVITGVALAVTALWTAPVQANEFAASIQRYFDEHVRPWLQEAVVVDAVRAQNAETAGLSQEQIDALDKKWRAESKAGGGELVDKVLSRDLSAFLKKKKEESGGFITEAFVMDARGLNVGQSDVTSDYWQGDEDKWQKTYPAGKDAVFVDDIEFDESSSMFQSQISATVVDPQSGEPIGAITVGINMDKLME